MRVLVTLVVASALAIFYYLHNLNTQLVESTSKQSARQYAEVLSQFRTLYTEEVVETALKQGLRVTHDYQARGDAIPLPATFSMILGEKMGIDGMDVKARLYSAYPFPWREQSGGLQDDFARQAWQFLSENKNQPFIRIEKINDVETVRYAVADLMRPKCVNCHNTHPQTPKNDWQTNELRGVLEVNQTLTLGLDQINNILLEVVILVSLLLVLVFIMVALMLDHLRQANRSGRQLNKQLQEEVKERKTAELNANTARDEAHLANKTKSIFLANISHEIRTPMNAIMGYSQILKRDQSLTDDQRHSLQVVEQSSVHLLGLINDVLDISKIESGVQKINSSAFNLVNMLNGLCDLFKLKTEQKSLLWQVELDFIHPAIWVIADEGKLRQVLINIIGNALKFTDKGFINMTVTERTEGVFYFEVCDSGMGISAQEQNSLFTPFCQGQAGLEKGGTGLGLAISKKYLEMMNSTLQLKSQIGEGTTVSFYLDLKHCASPKEDTASKQSYKCLANRQHISVLVVDDIAVNRDIMTRVLHDAQFSVAQASCALMALDMMNTSSFDLIVTDIAMPDIDGITLMERGAKTKLNHHTPVVAISATNLEKDKTYYLNLGFANYLAKPFLIDDLFACIEQTLQIEFDYMEQPETEPQPVADKITLPPSDIVERLRTAAELYRISEIEEQLTALAAQNHHHDEFIKIMKTHIALYDMDALMAYLDQHT